MILERIKQYIDYKGISIAAFEKSIGMSNASFGKCLKKGGAIGTDKLENVLRVYPEISPEWLLTGAGPMLKEAPSAYDATVSGNSNGGSNITNSPNSPVNVNDSDTIRQLLTMLEAKDEQINTLLTIIQNGKAG